MRSLLCLALGWFVAIVLPWSVRGQLRLLRLSPESGRSAYRGCFDDVATYKSCCWCSAIGGGEPSCWSVGTFTYKACCTFPFGSLAADQLVVAPYMPCHINYGVRFEDVLFNIGGLQLGVRQERLEFGSRGLVAWTGGYLLAQLLFAGWIAPARESGALRILEVCACLGLPSFVAAHLGHGVLATDGDAQAVSLLQRNAAALRTSSLRAEQLNLSLAQAPPSYETGPFDVILLAGESCVDSSAVRALRSFCHNRTRVLTAFRPEAERTGARFMRFIQRDFDILESVGPGWVERGLWMPTGYKVGAMELRPKR